MRPVGHTSTSNVPAGDDSALTEHELDHIDESARRQAQHQGYYATGLEQTKSVFTLSSAGVGLALTLMFGSGARPTAGAWAPLWLLFATVAFGLAAIASIWVFTINSRLVLHLVRGWDSRYVNAKLKRVVLIGLWLFGFGLLFLVLAAIALLWLDPTSKP